MTDTFQQPEPAPELAPTKSRMADALAKMSPADRIVVAAFLLGLDVFLYCLHAFVHLGVEASSAVSGGIGTINTILTVIGAFYFGSSKGSAEKDATISTMAKDATQ